MILGKSRPNVNPSAEISDGAPIARRLKMEELKGRSLMIGAGGDNYSDLPEKGGGGGARIACGVIP